MNGKEIAPGSRKDLSLSIGLAGMTLVPAFLFSLKSDLPHVFAITALILGYSILRRKAIEFGDRPIIYFLVLSASLSVFLDMAIPMNDSRTGILDIVIKSSLSAPALLYMAAFTTLFRQRPAVLGIVATLSVAVMIVGGDIFRGSSLAPERIFFAKPLTDRFSELYMLCIAMELVFIVASLRLLGRHSTHGAPKSSLIVRDSSRALCLAILPLIAVGGTLLFYANERSIRDLEHFLSTGDLLRRWQQDALPFPEEADIAKGLPKEDPRRKAMIIARVKAKSPPGFLRAKCYTSYSEGRWSYPAISSPSIPLQGSRESETLTSAVFALASSAQPAAKQQRFEIFQSTSFSHAFLLIPANTNAIELVADKLSVNKDGFVEPTNWKPDAGFTAFVDSIDQNAAYREPGSVADSPEYLLLPDRLKAPLSEMSSLALEASAKGHLKGDVALAESVASVIRNRCQYTLETKDTPAGKDPVEEFLFITRKGHCELFASATVLTLRSMGIPARYVTGLVCDETHPSGAYYVARVGGAHAWCEAYLRDQGRWVLVESTPAAAFDSMKPSWGLFEAFADWVAQTFRQSMAWLQRGYFAQAVLELISDAALLIWSLASSRIGLAIEALLAALACAFFVRRLVNRRRLIARTPASVRRLRAEFKRLEAAASSHSGVRRGASMTLREWASLAKGSCGERLTELVLHYEGMRFRSTPPRPADVEAFSKEVSSFRKTL